VIILDLYTEYFNLFKECINFLETAIFVIVNNDTVKFSWLVGIV
jgi:hypothetical protein